MVVQRISDLNIKNKDFIVPINGYINDNFVDEDLCSYSFEHQLYLYLKKEGFDRIFFVSRARKRTFYSYETDCFKSLENANDNIKNSKRNDGRLGGSRTSSLPNSPTETLSYTEFKERTNRTYYCKHNLDDTALKSLIINILSDNKRVSAICFIHQNFEVREIQDLVDSIQDIDSSYATAGLKNKLIVNKNIFGNLFRNPFLAEKLNENVFEVTTPDYNECKNWINAKRIEGSLNSEQVFSFPFEDLVKRIYQKKKKISELQKELDIDKGNFIEGLKQSVLTDEQILSELNEMVGLDDVKNALGGLIADVKMQKLRKNEGLSENEKLSLNFVFKGNPGTGKTTVARLLGNILFNYGLIDSPEVVTYTKGMLLDGLVGGGSRLVEKMFQDSVGKLLFIDEAYQLAENDAKDALDAFTNLLTDKRFEDKLAVVLAGYPGDMAKLIQGNQGLERRFSNQIQFEDYTNAQLTEMFLKKVNSEGYLLDDEGILYAKHYFANLKRNISFKNAGEVRDLYKYIRINLSKRVTIIQGPSKDDLRTIKSEDFPNYNLIDIEKLKENIDINISSKEELEKLVGIDSIREQFYEYIKVAHYCRENPNSSISKSFRPHMAFKGSPGTGKTTVARLFAEILQMEGLLLNNSVVEVDPTDLIGQHLGDTGPKTRSVCERSRGGILFIDEAYQLCRKNQVNGGDQYGMEAITELIKFMEDDRDTIVILAGYPDEIEYLIEKGNPGLSSRVTNNFIFCNYNPDILSSILFNKLNEFSLTDEFKDEMKKIIQNQYNKHKDEKTWGNARTMENYATDIFRIYLNKCKSDNQIGVDCIPKDLKEN
ncbi:MAG: AAA family ATPase [Paludibacteraceae bacterium]|nr:AAA family ATPase [Paludibacteraceae bacterium]